MTNADRNAVEVRLLVSARNSGDLFELQRAVRGARCANACSMSCSRTIPNRFCAGAREHARCRRPARTGGPAHGPRDRIDHRIAQPEDDGPARTALPVARAHRGARDNGGPSGPAAMHVASLHLHPLKSCAQLDVDTIDVTPRGPAGDRRWLVVDGDDRFVTARQHAAMVGIRAVPAGDGLRLDAPGLPTLHVPAPDGRVRRRVTIWRDTVDAADAGDAAAAWLSRWLGMDARLVHMDAAAHRAVDPAFGAPGDEVAFADAYPLLVISQAALDALNARLPKPVPMARFRPNLVVGGSAPHAEDGWHRVRIGDVEFEAVKPCTRCVFTTIDPATMTRDPDGEPLRTLATYRRAPPGARVQGVTFGMNLIPRGSGRVRVGDALTPLG